MKTSHTNPTPKSPSLDAGDEPISLIVQVVIADARNAARVIKFSRCQSGGADPAALVALPGRLHGLLRAAEAEAQRGVNQFLAQLASAEPLPQTAKPMPEPVVRIVATSGGLRLETTQEHRPPASDYLLPVSLPPTGGLP